MSRVAEFWYSDRLRQVMVALGALVILVALPTIVWQEYHYNQVSDNHHAQSAAQQAEIISILNAHTNTLAEVKSLRAEVTKLVQQYGPALTVAQQTIVAEYTWIACALSNGPSKCGAVPT